MKQSCLTISDAAAASGLSAHTLRYYERIGLLGPLGRATNGHRRFSEADMAWIAFLIRLRATGMPIHKMQAFALLRRQGPASVSERRHMLEEHLETVEADFRRLEANLQALRDKVLFYKSNEEKIDGK